MRGSRNFCQGGGEGGGGEGGRRGHEGDQAHLTIKTSGNVFLGFYLAVLLVLTLNLFNSFTERSDGLLLGKL